MPVTLQSINDSNILISVLILPNLSFIIRSPFSLINGHQPLVYQCPKLPNEPFYSNIWLSLIEAAKTSSSACDGCISHQKKAPKQLYPAHPPELRVLNKDRIKLA